jgi:RNA polymerase sigma factor (sigma-70 family)
VRVDPDRLDDAELLARVARGQAAGEAFAAFYRRHEVLVLAYLRRRVNAGDIAVDLAAETFAGALQAAGRFDVDQSPDGTAAGWLLGIARHQLLASIRRGRVADELRRALHMADPLVVDDHDLARVDELASLTGRPAELLADLPDSQRAAIEAHVLEDRTYEDIAAELRCSVLVVRKRVSRGLSRLRSRLAEETT